MPGKAQPTQIQITEQDIAEYRQCKKRIKTYTEKSEVQKKKFNDFAESVGFDESPFVIIERGDEEVTVTEIESTFVTEDALDIIESDPIFKRYKKCIETVKVVNTALLMEDLERDYNEGLITKRQISKIIKTKSHTRVT